MGLFFNAEDKRRREHLRVMEDRRLAFARQMAAEGFQPEYMLFAQTARGGYAAACVHGGRRWLIVSPDFGGDGDFVRAAFAPEDVRRTEVYVEGEGMGGILGMGKRRQEGVEYTVPLPDGSEAVVPFVFGRTSWAEFRFGKNPLLKTARRRGDANVAWELMPIDSASANHVLALAERYFT